MLQLCPSLPTPVQVAALQTIKEAKPNLPPLYRQLPILQLLLLGRRAHVLVKRAIRHLETRKRLEANSQDGKHQNQDDERHEDA